MNNVSTLVQHTGAVSAPSGFQLHHQLISVIYWSCSNEPFYELSVVYSLLHSGQEQINQLM